MARTEHRQRIEVMEAPLMFDRHTDLGYVRLANVYMSTVTSTVTGGRIDPL